MCSVNTKALSETGTIVIDQIQLESGQTLEEVEVAYERSGNRNKPIILICHALTGNQHTVGNDNNPGWWSGLIGDNRYLTTNDWQIITFNVLGGCNGTTGPTSKNPRTNLPYQSNFPFITVRDMVTVHFQALNRLGITHIHAAIGGSLGGMQVLELGIMYPDFVDNLFPLAVTPCFSDYGIAYNTIARKAIINDPLWKSGKYDSNHPPIDGLSSARMIGMITYRSASLFNKRFARKEKEAWGNNHQEKSFDIESYLYYQGEKLTNRFDANSYLYLLKAMDSHDIGRGRGGWINALNSIKAKVTALGFKDDLIYQPEALKDMIDILKMNHQPVSFHLIETDFGHDGFLVEFKKWAPKILEGLYAN